MLLPKIKSGYTYQEREGRRQGEKTKLWQSLRKCSLYSPKTPHNSKTSTIPTASPERAKAVCRRTGSWRGTRTRDCSRALMPRREGKHQLCRILPCNVRKQMSVCISIPASYCETALHLQAELCVHTFKSIFSFSKQYTIVNFHQCTFIGNH